MCVCGGEAIESNTNILFSIMDLDLFLFSNFKGGHHCIIISIPPPPSLFKTIASSSCPFTGHSPLHSHFFIALIFHLKRETLQINIFFIAKIIIIIICISYLNAFIYFLFYLFFVKCKMKVKKTKKKREKLV